MRHNKAPNSANSLKINSSVSCFNDKKRRPSAPTIPNPSRIKDTDNEDIFFINPEDQPKKRQEDTQNVSLSGDYTLSLSERNSDSRPTTTTMMTEGKVILVDEQNQVTTQYVTIRKKEREKKKTYINTLYYSN